jgi:hypothetical protein
LSVTIHNPLAASAAAIFEKPTTISGEKKGFMKQNFRILQAIIAPADGSNYREESGQLTL